MSDELFDALGFEESPESSWYPSANLRRRLLVGALATLATGTAMMTASLVDPALDLFPGFSVASALGCATLVPLFLMLLAYQGLAGETNSNGLRKGSAGVFGTVLLLGVFEIATLKGLPLGWQITCWVTVALGLLALVVLPFGSEDNQEKKASEAAQVGASVNADKPPTVGNPRDESSAAASRVGIVGGIGVALVVILKLFAKGMFKILVLGRLFKNLDLETVEGLVGAGLLILGVGYTLWFAVAKIQLRRQLGGLAALLGFVEILVLAAGAVLIAWLLMTALAVANQPGINEKDVEALLRQKSRDLLPLEIVSEVAWTALSMFLFLSVRSRTNLEEEWKRDLASAPPDLV